MKKGKERPNYFLRGNLAMRDEVAQKSPGGKGNTHEIQYCRIVVLQY
jgi:hypothetical protein